MERIPEDVRCWQFRPCFHSKPYTCANKERKLILTSLRHYFIIDTDYLLTEYPSSALSFSFPREKEKKRTSCSPNEDLENFRIFTGVIGSKWWLERKGRRDNRYDPSRRANIWISLDSYPISISPMEIWSTRRILEKGNQLRRPFDPPFRNSPVVVAKGKRVFQISSRKKFNLAASQRLKASTSEQLLSFSLGH